MSGEHRLDRQASDEPSLGMSFGVLCLVLLAMFVIVANVSVPEVHLAADLLVGL
jgi:Flp pilus assembly protein TadB